MKPRAVYAEALRGKIASSTVSRQAIAAARAQAAVPLRSIALLTDVLPDDTYLMTFDLRRNKVTITGRSAAAARLIGAMAAQTRIRDPAFTAPITRKVTRSGETFAIRAEFAE
jgi:general secretion pathway protein L